MVAAEVRTDFIGITTNITKENRSGSVEVFIQVQGMAITDAELAELRRLQGEFAAKVDEVLEEKKADSESQPTEKILKYKNGRPYFDYE